MAKLDGKVFSGYASRCSCCNAMMSDERICFDGNGQLDDLCTQCRRIVNSAIDHAEDDIASLPHEQWRAKLGEADVFDDPERDYQGD